MSDLEGSTASITSRRRGFERKECPSCGAHFWTRDADRELCGEPPCEDYSFIDDPGFPEAYSLSEMRGVPLILRGAWPRANRPVSGRREPLARRRTPDAGVDLRLPAARHVGTDPPPANPLTISQPCIRMQDIDNVGKTGRHTMAFEMMAHHAFNTREEVAEDEYAYHGEVYWKDETVEYCDKLFESLGADLEDITYTSRTRGSAAGNAGPAIEVIYKGAELATLVFMCMERDPTAATTR